MPRISHPSLEAKAATREDDAVLAHKERAARFSALRELAARLPQRSAFYRVFIEARDINKFKIADVVKSKATLLAGDFIEQAFVRGKAGRRAENSSCACESRVKRRDVLKDAKLLLLSHARFSSEEFQSWRRPLKSRASMESNAPSGSKEGSSAFALIACSNAPTAKTTPQPAMQYTQSKSRGVVSFRILLVVCLFPWNERIRPATSAGAPLDPAPAHCESAERALHFPQRGPLLFPGASVLLRKRGAARSLLLGSMHSSAAQSFVALLALLARANRKPGQLGCLLRLQRSVREWNLVRSIIASILERVVAL